MQGSRTVISFANGFLATAENFGFSGLGARPPVETSVLTTTPARTFEPEDVYGPGEMTCTLQFDSSKAPPITEAPEQITITWPDGKTRSCMGWLSDNGMTVEKTDVIRKDVTITFTGEWTFVT